MGWMTTVHRLAEAGIFYLHHCIQTGSGAHLHSYPMGTGALIPGIKWPGHKVDHLPPSSAKVRNG